MAEPASIAGYAISHGTKRWFSTTRMLVETGNGLGPEEAVAESELVAVDGMPLVWVSKFPEAQDAERVNGPDALLAFCAVGRGGIGSRLGSLLLSCHTGNADEPVSRLRARPPDLTPPGRTPRRGEQ